MKRLLVVVGVIVGLAALIAVIGMMRPRSHEARLTVRLGKPPADVWAVITDFARLPEWNQAITQVARQPDRDGKAVWKENYGGFNATVVSAVVEPPTRLVREILPEGPFYGSWTWELAPDGGGTRLTIIERGTVDNPFYRGMMVFHDNTKTARDYAAALAGRLGTELVPVP